MKFDYGFKSWAMATAALAAFVQPASAQEQAREFNIPAQSLSSALNAFGQQSGKSILFSNEVVGARQSVAVQGAHTPTEALRILLGGSGLQFHTNSDGTFLVDAAVPTQAAGEAGGTDSATAEILVHGTRSLDADIRRTENDTQPYVVFNAEDIRNSGAGDLNDFLKNRLPMNTQSLSTNQLQVGQEISGQINLRGLGADETLVLVDGRRVPGTATFDGLGQPVITGIPTAAIDRIEILPSTAGGIYGGSATGGVVNIILKHDYTGWDFQGTYGNTFDTDVGEANVSLSGGFSLNQDRTHVMVSVNRRTQNGLTSADRSAVRRATEMYFANDPTNAFQIPVIGSTPNICSSSFEGFCDPGAPLLVLDNGQALGSAITHVPFGYLGPASDNGAALLANAGTYDINPGPGSFVQSRNEGEFYSLDVRQEFTDWFEGYLNASEDIASQPLDGAVFGSVVLPANDPNNPFQQDIYVTVPGRVVHGSRETDNLVVQGGLIARLPHTWVTSLEYSWGRSQGTNSFLQPLSSVTTPPVSADETAYLQSIALLGPATYSLDYSRLDGQNFQLSAGDITSETATFRFSGPVASLPGGPITLSGSAEWREQSAGALVTGWSDAIIQGSGAHYRAVPERSESVRSLYLEARAPLVSSMNAVPLVRYLELMASVRSDQYSLHLPETLSFVLPSIDTPIPSTPYDNSTFRSVNYTVGLRYKPIDDLTIRGSFGTGFLPPSFSQAGTPTLTTLPFAFLHDPQRGNSLIPAGLTVTAAGNPNLKPEESESLSFGLIYAPDFVEGLRISVDYTRIHKTNEISSQDIPFFLNNEALFPGRVTRGPLTPADVSLGYTAGPVLAVDDTYINLARTRVEAFDVQIDYRLQTQVGEFHPYAILTFQPIYDVQETSAASLSNTVGKSDGPLQWRGNFGVDWKLGPWQLGWNAQYFDSYSLCRHAACDSFIIDAQGTDDVPHQIYNDLYVNYDFDGGGVHSLLSGTQVSLGIQNIFNEEPPVIVNTYSYSAYGDPRLRRFTLTLRKHF